MLGALQPCPRNKESYCHYIVALHTAFTKQNSYVSEKRLYLYLQVMALLEIIQVIRLWQKVELKDFLFYFLQESVVQAIVEDAMGKWVAPCLLKLPLGLCKELIFPISRIENTTDRFVFYPSTAFVSVEKSKLSLNQSLEGMQP